MFGAIPTLIQINKNIDGNVDGTGLSTLER